jgi:2-methylaconitate cis-trans-isomerase PrpF
MNIKTDDHGNIIIDPFELIELVPSHLKIELIERLSCEDEVIKHVMDQVFVGLTENGYAGSESMDDLQISTELQQARERIRLQGNRLLMKEIKRLRKKVENLNQYFDAGWNEYHKLLNETKGR